MLLRLNHYASFRIFVFLVLLGLLLMGLSLGEVIHADAPWDEFAHDYINADGAIVSVSLNKEGKETVVAHIQERTRAKERLIASTAPDSSEIKKLLESQDPLDRKVALVNIMIRNAWMPEFAKTVIERYGVNDDFFLKFYSFQSLSVLDSNGIIQFEDDISRIITAESEGNIIISAMPLLLKMKKSKAVPLFAMFLESNDKGVRLSACVYLIKADESYLNGVTEILKKKGADEALRFLHDTMGK